MKNSDAMIAEPVSDGAVTAVQRSTGVVVRGLNVYPVAADRHGGVDMVGVSSASAVKEQGLKEGLYVELSEPFWMQSEGLYVAGWTEQLLERLDRLGITFAAELSGPVLVPCKDDLEVLVPVWFSASPTGWEEHFRTEAGVLRVTNEFMSGEQLVLSVEDKAFLAAYYPYEQPGYPEDYYDVVCERLGVKYR